jgi:cytochrome c oxidase subunit II
MAAVEQAGTLAAGRAEPRHWLRLLVMWLVLSLAADLVIWFVWYPHLPPGRMADSASGQQFDIAVLAVTAAPVVIGVLLYFIYAIIVWRAKPGDNSDGPLIRGNIKVQAAWIIGTSAIVMFLFVFGTVELIVPADAGGGEGPSPIWKPAGTQSSTWTPGTNTILQVQVIGQQWAWTYRYPQFGGFETAQLMLPIDTPIEFHVTSLDVIHDFWAYQLGVKADANPQVDNVAYTTAKQLGSFTVRCDELCGLWHGAMYDYGQVVSGTAFQSWAATTEAKLAPLTKTLPPYSLIYTPNEIKGLANFYYQAGLPGAGGQYYGSQYYPNQP